MIAMLLLRPPRVAFQLPNRHNDAAFRPPVQCELAVVVSRGTDIELWLREKEESLSRAAAERSRPDADAAGGRAVLEVQAAGNDTRFAKRDGQSVRVDLMAIDQPLE